MTYDSSNIKVLSAEEVLGFDYALITHLTSQYSKPLVCVKRGIEASRLMGMDPKDYYIPRYLEGNKDIPVNTDFTAVYQEIMKEG